MSLAMPAVVVVRESLIWLVICLLHFKSILEA